RPASGREGGLAHHRTGSGPHRGGRGSRLLRVQQSRRQDVPRRRDRRRAGRDPLAALASRLPVRPALGRRRSRLHRPDRREAQGLASTGWGARVGVASRLVDCRRARDCARDGLRGKRGRGVSAGEPSARVRLARVSAAMNQPVGRSLAAGLLALLRPPNVFTAVADSAAGLVLARRAGPLARDPGLWCLAASACLYLGGIALNDYFDRDVDAVERPERPIPSGAVPPAVAAGLGASLPVAGIALARLAGGS